MCPACAGSPLSIYIFIARRIFSSNLCIVFFPFFFFFALCSPCFLFSSVLSSPTPCFHSKTGTKRLATLHPPSLSLPLSLHVLVPHSHSINFHLLPSVCILSSCTHEIFVYCHELYTMASLSALVVSFLVSAMSDLGVGGWVLVSGFTQASSLFLSIPFNEMPRVYLFHLFLATKQKASILFFLFFLMILLFIPGPCALVLLVPPPPFPFPFLLAFLFL